MADVRRIHPEGVWVTIAAVRTITRTVGWRSLISCAARMDASRARGRVRRRVAYGENRGRGHYPRRGGRGQRGGSFRRPRAEAGSHSGPRPPPGAGPAPAGDPGGARPPPTAT